MNRNQAAESLELMREFPINCPVVWECLGTNIGVVVGYEILEVFYVVVRDITDGNQYNIDPFSKPKNLRKEV